MMRKIIEDIEDTWAHIEEEGFEELEGCLSDSGTEEDEAAVREGLREIMEEKRATQEGMFLKTEDGYVNRWAVGTIERMPLWTPKMEEELMPSRPANGRTN